MKQLRPAIVYLVTAFATLSLSQAETPIGSTAPDFSLNDQYDHPLQLSALRGKPVLLICGDKKGSEYISAWASAVHKEVSAAGAKVIPVANLRAVPGFLHGYVKGKFLATRANGQAPGPVLLDWDGWIASHYGEHEKVANVYLVNAEGRLVFSGSGSAKPEEVRPLAEALKTIGSAEKTH